MAKNILKTANRAIKTPLKLMFAGIFIFLGLLFTNEAISGASPFTDGFETCTPGQYLQNANCGWDSSIGEWLVIEGYQLQNCAEGERCIVSTDNLDKARKSGVELATGTLGFWFMVGENDTSLWSLYQDPAENLLFTIVKSAGSNLYYYGKNPTLNYWLIFPAPQDIWNYFIMEWKDSDQVRFNLNGGWSEWLVSAYSRVSIQHFLAQSDNVGYALLDHFTDDPEFKCEAETCELCETSYTCQQAGCAWYYHPLFGNYCEAIHPTECASGWDSCQHCGTIETCEAEDFCYWFENSCWYGTGVCGEGLELQFCATQGECEGAGGYWYDNFCWISGPPINLLDWEDYYAEFGDYATASPWITGVASSTTGFFGVIGGFLSAFSDSFNLQDAYSKGETMGSAIPTARSYLEIINEFFGNLPFAEFFIFILGFMLAIGVFRITRNLIQTLKFW